jgi:hypothetical protein
MAVYFTETNTMYIRRDVCRKLTSVL